jgi:hypothetical protein
VVTAAVLVVPWHRGLFLSQVEQIVPRRVKRRLPVLTVAHELVMLESPRLATGLLVVVRRGPAISGPP